MSFVCDRNARTSPRYSSIELAIRSGAETPVVPDAAILAAGAHHQADEAIRDSSLQRQASNPPAQPGDGVEIRYSSLKKRGQGQGAIDSLKAQLNSSFLPMIRLVFARPRGHETPIREAPVFSA
jgi:hypothetical protein